MEIELAVRETADESGLPLPRWLSQAADVKLNAGDLGYEDPEWAGWY